MLEKESQLFEQIKGDIRIQDVRWIAYILATVKHETANTFKPITEYGPRKYFDKYEPTTKIGKSLGNKSPGDGYKYRGRGYCQITGVTNVQRFGKLLDLPLIENPELTLHPDVAYEILIQGMIDGLFTGKKLANYFNDDLTDWINARRIINGLDKAELIAGYAKDYFKLFTNEILSDEKSSKVKKILAD